MIESVSHRSEHDFQHATTVVIVLAAGGGSRFLGDTHKLLASLPGDRIESVLGRSLRHAIEADVGPIIVVVGAIPEQLLRLDTSVQVCLDDERVMVVHNPEWAAGQATSIGAGIGIADTIGATAVVVGLGDQPGITPDAWRSVASGTAPISVATYDGRRGNPVRLDATIWSLLPTGGDQGARVLMNSRPDLVGEVPCTGLSADIDTVEDLDRWQNN